MFFFCLYITTYCELTKGIALFLFEFFCSHRRAEMPAVDLFALAADDWENMSGLAAYGGAQQTQDSGSYSVCEKSECIFCIYYFLRCLH